MRALEAQAGRSIDAANNRTWGLEVGCHNAHESGSAHTSVGIYVHTGLSDFIGGAAPKRCNTGIFIEGTTTSFGGRGWERFILCRQGYTDSAFTMFEVTSGGSVIAQGEAIVAGDVSSTGGDMYANSFIQNPSSQVDKENVVPLDDQEAVSVVRTLRPVRYDLIARPSRRLMGFIVEEVPPEFVVESKGETATRGVDVTAIVATLVGAVRAQSEAIDRLQSQVDRLQGGAQTP